MPTTISGTDGVSAVVDGTIVAADIASDAVTTAKILNANITPAKLSQPFTLATAQNSTSGTSIDFTGIPSWAKRITVMFDGVSTNGTSVPLIRLGDAGGIESSGYVSVTTGASTTADLTRGGSSTNGFRLAIATHAAANTIIGAVYIANISGNVWCVSGSLVYASIYAVSVAGSKTLSDVLTQVSITTSGGTETFDAGTINISYEG